MRLRRRMCFVNLIGQVRFYQRNFLLRSQAVVGFQQSAKAFDALDFGRFVKLVLCFDDPAQRLVNAFVVIIVAVLIEHVLELFDGRQNQMIKAF
ncbi:hypothetical protein STSP2_02211 [Anaerohalosphaera lusitana]|uniref:Uncharacterized protein n=1 Tax=Anaerohalosphaera lusitana TaxID=1936003 RepID=A0A1U9NM75_9BACT|nr:hypothetical protein [Anaerohalosphaera lusitana]AQT69031.1 hypothetical protein STSP2_02211 [Anaerohalosphaera lusitana]